VITSVGAAAMLTVTLPDAWPEADGVVPVVGVVPPVAGGVVVVVPTPTLAVTVAALDVVSTLFAVPVASVIATPVLSEPAVEENVTGTSGSTAPFKSKTIALIVLVPPTVGSGVVAALFGRSGPQDDVALAHTIAHETGHYLGLYHPTEHDGEHGDQLPDTPFCGATIETNPLSCPDLTNLMFFAIREPLADQSQLTPGQTFVLQRHPLIHD